MSEHETVFNVYLIQDDRMDHVMLAETREEAENFIRHMIAVDDFSGDFHYLLEREVITKTRFPVSRHEADGTVRLAK